MRVSRAAADQRRGRAGRTEPGACYRLWDEAETRALPAYADPEILDAAHQCSARYPRETSEFDATGLTAHFEPGFAAPFVGESRFRIGLELEDIIHIPANGTKLIVGRVVLVQVADEALTDHGGIDLVGLECLASTALDTYFCITPLVRLPYAKATA